MKDLQNRIETALSSIRAVTDFVPEIALILGSGMGDIVREFEGVAIEYADIEGFPVSTAPGHDGRLLLGTWTGRNVAIMQGRVHLYEGYSPANVAFPVMVLAELGVKTVIITNAAGGLNPDYAAGDIVVIEDHLSLANLSGLDPLRGAHDPTLGERFVSLNGAYNRDLIAAAKATSETLGLPHHCGIYGFAVGPTLETPAEVRALRMLGCDLVGMSTVPEVIAARFRGLDVLGLSVMCNHAVDSVDSAHVTCAEEVYAVVKSAVPKLSRYLSDLLPRL